MRTRGAPRRCLAAPSVLTRRRARVSSRPFFFARRYVADTLLYDKTHLPRTAPAPDCVRRDRDKAAGEQPPPPQPQQQQQQQQADANAAKLS